MRPIRVTGSKILLSVLDLDVEEGIGVGGGHYKGQVDPKTGLLMAGDVIHVPAGVVIGIGPDAHPRIPLGRQVIVQRIRRDKVMMHEGMHIQYIETRARCVLCGAGVPTDEVIARMAGLTEEGDTIYQAEGGRVLVRPTVTDDDTRWGEVVSVGADVADVQVGDHVAWEDGRGTHWKDGQVEWYSLRAERHCPGCRIRTARGDVLLTAAESPSAERSDVDVLAPGAGG